MSKYLLLSLPAMLFLIVSCTGGKQASQSSEPAIEYVFMDTMSVIANVPEISYKETDQRIHDLLHTSLDVAFDFENQYLLGKAELTLSPHFYPSSSLTLDAKGFDLHEVALLNGTEKQAADYQYDGWFLVIDLGKEYKRGEQYKVYIDYTAKPEEIELEGSEAIKERKGLYFINPLGTEEDKPTQIWTQGETEASSIWFPTIDSPNERCTQELRMTVPDRMVTLSNGSLVSSEVNADGTRSDYWVQKLPHAPYLFAMAAGEFAVVKDKWRDIEVNYYVEKEYEQHARAIFGNTPEMMEFYSNMLQYDYPWEKYSQVVVRDFVSGAMENTGAVIYLDIVQRTTRELLDDDYEDIIAHELFHHWFGDLVTCESWANLPLNEAFATYGEYLWHEYKYGRDHADYLFDTDLETYLSESQFKQEPLIRFHYEKKEDMFDAHSYQKGGRVLHMLRKYIGDDAFFESLRLYLKQNEYKPVEIHNLRLAIEEVTGMDLNWFFDQWFMTAGHPELDITYDYFVDRKQASVNIEQIHEHDLVYRLPISIDIYVDGKVIREEVVVDEQKQRFTFDVASQPDLMNVDAEKMLLVEKDDRKTLEEYIFQYYNAPLFMDRAEALDVCRQEQVLSPEAAQVLIDAHKDAYWALRQYAIDNVSMEKENKEALILQWKEMAEKDEKSLVRAAAIQRLGDLQDRSLAPIFVNAGQDQSYEVIATSISAISLLDLDEGLKLCEQYRELDNSSLIRAIGGVYAMDANPDHQDYFERQIETAAGFRLFYLIDHYYGFLENSDLNVIENGKATLARVAKEADNEWIRYRATYSLYNLKQSLDLRKDELGGDAISDVRRNNLDRQIEEIAATIEDIKSKETNEEVQVYYQLLK